MKKTIVIACLVFSGLIMFANNPLASEEKKVDRSSGNISQSLQQMQNIYPIWGYYIDASPGIAKIKINAQSSKVWKSETSFGYNLSLGYFRSLSPFIKVKLGIGVSSYDISLTGGGEIQSPELMDIDNDTYTELLTISNAEHNVNPLYLSIPLTFEFGTVNINKIGYYADLGFEYSFLFDDNNTTNGSYTTKGTYPQWGVTLEDVPELGFYSARELESGLNLQKSIYSIKGGAGITIPISGVIIFKLGFTGRLGLKNIGNNSSAANEIDPLSEQTYDFRSTYIHNPLAASKNNKANYLGIEFGVYICKLVK